MDLRKTLYRLSVFLLLVSDGLIAAPQLRLATSVVGPVSVALGGTAAGPSIDIANIGDGTLSPQLTSTVPWLVPTLGPAHSCGLAPTCQSVQLSIQAGSLTRGLYSGFVRVSDPNAIDAPQTIVVTVQVGSSLPDTVNLYAAPNGSPAQFPFVAASPIQSSVTTQGGVGFLAVSASGAGTFNFSIPYTITADPAGLSEGKYTGSIVTSGSTSSSDNKTVPVTFTVTSQPIAQASQISVDASTAQGGPKQTSVISLSNPGAGTLSVSGVTAATATGGNWLTATPVAGGTGATLTIDPTGLSPGAYQGTATVSSNAINSPTIVPVNLTVTAQGPPVAFFHQVLNNATFEPGEGLAPGSIAALKGEQLSLSDPQSAASLPLSTNLGGTQVFVNNQPAPVYYSSYGQVNFQIPFETPIGPAIVRADRNGQRGNSVSVNIVKSSPRILRLNIKDYGIITNQDLTFPIPATPGIPSHPAKAGDVLVIYALGLGQTTPPQTSGTAAPSVEPLPRVPGFNGVVFGGGGFAGDGVTSTPFYVGLAPTFVGLYQINVVVPAGILPGNEVGVVLVGDDGMSNRVTIAVQ